MIFTPSEKESMNAILALMQSETLSVETADELLERVIKDAQFRSKIEELFSEESPK